MRKIHSDPQATKSCPFKGFILLGEWANLRSCEFQTSYWMTAYLKFKMASTKHVALIKVSLSFIPSLKNDSSSKTLRVEVLTVILNLSLKQKIS